MRPTAQEVHETNSEMAASLEKRIDQGYFTNARDCFFWMLGYAFDRETCNRIMNKIRAAEAKAGGGLIAAAPDLLVALKSCMRFIEAHDEANKDGATMGPTYATARAAIAKAEGRQ